MLEQLLEENETLSMDETELKTERLPVEGRKKSKNSGGLSCLICGKIFQYDHRMKIHIRTHTGECPYACSYCNKSFAQKAALIVHERTHTGERPYSCHLCGKSFARADHLNQHSRTHTGEKPYSCSLCSRSFATWSAISRHRAEHVSRDNFSCTHCKKTFSRSDNLRSHVMKTHLKDQGLLNEVVEGNTPIKIEQEVPAPYAESQTGDQQSSDTIFLIPKTELP